MRSARLKPLLSLARLVGAKLVSAKRKAGRRAWLSRRQEAARAPQPLAMNALAVRKRPLVTSKTPPARKEIFCPRPAAQGRHAPSLANHGSSRGSPAAPGASAGSVVPRGPAAPLRVNRCGRAIAPASVFATAFGQPAYAVCLRQRAQPAAYAHARPVARQP